MKTIVLYVLCMICGGSLSVSAALRTCHSANDIYLVIYITRGGHTGHVGFAVDNYKVVVTDTTINGQATRVYDSVKTNTLTYFDLWGPADIGIGEHDQDLPARYYTLPRSSSEQRLNPDFFLTKGLPHSYDYPCDAMLKIRTTPTVDAKLKEIAAAVQVEKKFFNSRSYNCSDYAITCLNRLFNLSLIAKEYIPFQYSSTPNQFYLRIIKALDVEIIKPAGEEVNNSFFRERVMNSEIINQLINEKTNE